MRACYSPKQENRILFSSVPHFHPITFTFDLDLPTSCLVPFNFLHFCLHCRFEKLQKEHETKYQSILQQVIQSSPVEDRPEVAAGEVVGEEGQVANAPPGAPAEHEFKTFADFDALNASDEVATRCSSELPGVEILKGKSGKIYLMSNKKRIVAKNTLIGGYGAGKCFDLLWLRMFFFFCGVWLWVFWQSHILHHLL